MEKKTKENNSGLLCLLDENDSDENNSTSNEIIEQQSFLKQKKKKNGMMVLFIVMFSALFGAGLAVTLLSEKSEKTDERSEQRGIDYEEFTKGRLTGSLKLAMNIKETATLTEKTEDIPVVKTKIEKQGGHSKNKIKDEEIIAKYASEIDAAADESITGNPRTGRRHFVPGGGNTQGGVFIKGLEKSTASNLFELHNLQIKVRLEYSIRSTSASTVVAIVAEDSDKIPKGSKFYGTATGYVNKRTQLSFNKLIINAKEYSVKGFAISGRDPGIESEVTDISKENIDSSIKQGIVQTASNIAIKYAGAVSGNAAQAAGNTVDPASSEIQKQQEANKMTQEYRVPAGTGFLIYLE